MFSGSSLHSSLTCSVRAIYNFLIWLVISTRTDLPLILILSLYTYFLTFYNLAKYRILALNFGKISVVFFRNGKAQRVFLIVFLIIHIFFPKIQNFLIIYTDFVSDQCGRSVREHAIANTLG